MIDSYTTATPGRLGAWCVDEFTSLLFISVYPLDLRSLQRDGSCDDLQPPFSPIDLSERVRRLTEAVGAGR